MELREDTKAESAETETLPASVPTPAKRRAPAIAPTSKRLPIPKIKVTAKEDPDGAPYRQVGFDGDQSDQWATLQKFARAIGCSDDFTHAVIYQLAETLAGAEDNTPHRHAEAINFVMSIIHDLKPRDTAEAMLATQMAVGHLAAMFLGGGLFRGKTLERQLAISKHLNNFARTFAAQMQTLKVYRAKGKQSIVVKHVTVTHGGQAIIGRVKHGGRARDASEKLETTT
jgi:hypothetical protein